MDDKLLLHVGCGNQQINSTPFRGKGFREIRVDADPRVRPDIVGTITDLSEIDANSCDAIYSSHNLEHLYAHEVDLALKEFNRVLKPTGFLLVTCPDLQSVAEEIVADRLTDTVYMSTAGAITPLDIVFGLRSDLKRGNDYMAHKCGFTASVLSASIRDAGFSQVACQRRGANLFDLWALATKTKWSDELLFSTTKAYFP